MSQDNTENKIQSTEKYNTFTRFLRLLTRYQEYLFPALLLLIFSFIAVFILIFSMNIWFSFNGAYGKSWTWLDRGLPSWAVFSSSLMPILQTILSCISILVTICAGLIITLLLDRRRSITDSNRELVRLSEMMFDAEFYTNVTVPAWEAAVKWSSLGKREGADEHEQQKGAAYRAEVAAGELILPMENYIWGLSHRGSTGRSIRMHPHYRAYDDALPIRTYIRSNKYIESKSVVKSEMSEHMALTTWVRFWIHVSFLVEQNILESETVKEMFQGWYEWWFQFMHEFVAVSIALKYLSGNPLRDHYLIKLQLFQRTLFSSPIDYDFEQKIIETMIEIKPELLSNLNITIEISEDVIKMLVSDDFLKKNITNMPSYLTAGR